MNYREFDEQTNGPKHMSSLFDNYEIKKTKHEHEFQEICEDLQKDFGKLVWTLPFKPWCTEFKLRKAGEIARKRGVKKFPYLVGIIKRLP